MALLIECFEDWGAATGSPPQGTTRTKVTNFGTGIVTLLADEMEI